MEPFINKAFVGSQVYFPYHSITYYYYMRFTTIFAGLFEGYWQLKDSK